MQICAPLTKSQCKVSDTQVTVRPVGLLFRPGIKYFKLQMLHTSVFSVNVILDFLWLFRSLVFMIFNLKSFSNQQTLIYM